MQLRRLVRFSSTLSRPTSRAFARWERRGGDVAGANAALGCGFGAGSIFLFRPLGNLLERAQQWRSYLYSRVDFTSADCLTQQDASFRIAPKRNFVC